MISLTVGTIIGAGRHGKVYHGQWHERKVALKKFPIAKGEVHKAEAIQREIETLQSLVNRHLVQYYGNGTTYHEDMLVLVMDEVEGGSLQQAIETQIQPHQQMDWPTKSRITQEIACGLAYLHHHQVLHIDLKSSNVLLKRHHPRLQVKLCDFWLPTIKAQSSCSNEDHPALRSASSRWMAPEIFADRPEYSTKSDMYALGMVMWEMAANCTIPFHSQLDNAVVVAIVKRGEREILPEDTPSDYCQWVHRCWSHDPEKRPEASEMATMANEAPSPPRSAITILTTTKETKSTLEAKPPAPSASAPVSTIPTPSTAMVEDFLVLSASAYEGDVEAQLTLAAAYEQGLDGVDRDPAEAFQWYLRAATYDSAESQYKVGHCFTTGRGTPKNLGSGFYWMLRAAEQQHVCAQNDVGWMYHQGLGTDRDDGLALTWYRKAAAKGNAMAQFNIGWMYHNAHGVSEDYEEALSWYRKAALQGNASAQTNIGVMYLHGLGSVSQDYDEALQWIRLAATQGDAAALNNLGWMYQNGLGVRQDYREAIAQYQSSAIQGNADAQLNLGIMNEEGLGVAKDVQQAAIWYRMAAEQGLTNAQERLQTVGQQKGFFRLFFG
ncbi:hypothetical protein BGZ73_007591 [Actinomortierella ambigua]|nr:hypothetical protein BGZ73_007591 [Actinomortierella ambigua]